uniref:ATP-dependent helicase C-terminal domain-containing protein n=1 Tax=Dongshaea marina TaxID=2047966 RepID=UPI002D779F5C|nr:ATP-dependent helicase C-terminal domain-containing protein [Dongshaea marina]
MQRRPLTELNPQQKAQCLLEGVRELGESVLPWDTQSQQYWQRICCAGEWLSDLGFEAMAADSLMTKACEWLLPALDGMSRLEQLKSLKLKSLLRDWLGWPLSARLDELLPESLETPTGSRARIEYQMGQAPLVAVKLQEMLGQVDSPRIAEGRVAVVVDLLSPARRPLQRTSDLRSFWQGAYTEVRKEMRGRYPKHYWPEDPLTAEPTRRLKKHLEQSSGR